MANAPRASFADIAVSLSLVLPTLRLAQAKTEAIGSRIGLSDMGIEVALEELRQDMRNIEQGLEDLKLLAEIETEVRALMARKRNGSWLARLQKVAAL